MLFSYLQKTQLLLSDKTQEAFNVADLTSYINTSRGQVAGDAECIRAIGALDTVQATQTYQFSAITGFPTGVASAINVRTIWYSLGAGQQYITPKSYEWVGLYYTNNPLAPQGPPRVWSQYAQGNTGSLFIGPIPDAVYALQLDTVCAPIALVDDTTVELIPGFWQDAVPFMAAFYALLYAQKFDDAKEMFGLYEKYRDRARQFANPSVLPGIWEQAQDPTMPAKLGLQKAGG